MWALFVVCQAICQLTGAAWTLRAPQERISFPHALAATSTVTAFP
jgi:hypothetical protein